jgi:L,D-transpeptidase ErfK/SrfK
MSARARQPAGDAGAEPLLALLPHPRHQRHPQIGRQSSNGCIGLFNEHIEEVFARARIGTQVVLT